MELHLELSPLTWQMLVDVVVARGNRRAVRDYAVRRRDT